MVMNPIRHLMLAMLAIAVALAGCATPEEADTGGDTNDTTDGGGLGGDTNDTTDDTGNQTGGDGSRLTGDVVMIDGNAYECDDTLNLDGVCDEWQLSEDADTQGAEEFQTEADGSVTIDGETYVCDDTNNVQTGTTATCETYLLQEEA